MELAKGGTPAGLIATTTFQPLAVSELQALGMGEALTARFGVKRVVHVRKANAATPAAREIIEALAKECDLVFAGSAD